MVQENVFLMMLSYFIMLLFQIWMYACSVFLVFAVTLSLFPGVLANVVSNSPYPESSGWTSKTSLFTG